MAVSGDEEHRKLPSENPVVDDDYEDGETVDIEEYDDDEDVEVSEESKRLAQKAKIENLVRRIATERIPLRVHNVLIKGITNTKEALIEAEIEGLRNSSSVQELLQAAAIANGRIQQLHTFDSVDITLDSGPPEFPGTTNVIVTVVETKNPFTGFFSKPEARTWSLGGSLKLKNLSGYGDLWDGSLVYGWDQLSEVGSGVYFPRIKGLVTPVTARVPRPMQDWLKFSSYNGQLMGISLSLLSTRNHDVAYNLFWHTLADPSQMPSRSIRWQLGNRLTSTLRYTFKIDKRNSPLRPTQGYAFVSTTQISGLAPGYWCLRYIRQKLDIRYAFPLGFYNAALNFGIGTGILFSWGRGFLSTPSSLSDRFFLGGNSSPVCTLGGPTSVLGFKTRGLGPTESRRRVGADTEASDSYSERNFLGGDLAVTGFVDLSFDLPLRVLREAGIQGHLFASAGSLSKITENAFRNLSFQKFRDSVRSSAGCGMIVLTKLFRVEVNYCYILKQPEYDRGKTGVQFSFSMS